MMKKLMILMVPVLALSYAALVGAKEGEHEHMEKGAMKHEKAQDVTQVTENVTLMGHVIDPVCYIRHDTKGADHKECALICAKAGITLAILEDMTGKIYLAFPEEHGDPNEKLLAFVEEDVKVTGTVYHGGGLTGIVVDKIEKVEMKKTMKMKME
ncbi:MAG: hypothetical protein V1800_00875 [Candidatus Latescibacterota bacterium]